MIMYLSIMKSVDMMRSERAIATLLMILTGVACTRKEIAIKLNCSMVSVSRAINDINCSLADYLNCYFQIKSINRQYRLIHEEYSPDFEFQNLIYELRKKV